MSYYITLNHRRYPSSKGPKRGQRTLWMTTEGKMAVTNWKFTHDGFSIRIPNFVATILIALRIAKRTPVCTPCLEVSK